MRYSIFGLSAAPASRAGLAALQAALATALFCAGLAHAAAAVFDPQHLTLVDARALMLERNRELQLARHAVAGADADVTIAAAPPNPVLSAGTARIGPRANSDSGSFPNRVDSSVGITQLFERGNKRELRTQAAQYNAAAARSDRADVERQQRLALAGAYYDLVLAQELLRVSAETAATFDKTLDAAQRRVQAGDLSRADLARLNVDALRARNEAQAIRLEQDKAQIALAYIIGLERDARNISAADAWPALQPSDASADIERLVELRPDVRAAQERLRAADRNRELAQSLRTRDVTAGVQYDRSPTDSASRNSVSFNFSVPLFTRYYYQGEIRRAESDYLAAETGVERVRATAMSDIATAAATLDSAAQRVRRFQGELLASAEQAASGAEFAYTRGAIGVMDLLDARRQLHATRVESVAALADYARAFTAWRLAVEPPGETSP